jgi:hypothetical protein
MLPIDETPPSGSKSSAAEGPKSKTTSSATEQPPSADFVAFTVDAATGRIINVEGVDAGGTRHAFSEVERARFVEKGSKATLEHVVEQAFEAGIDCLLGAESDQRKPQESDEDAELSRVLLRSLIEHSAAKHLLGRDVLSQAIVATLIEQAASLRAAAG